MRLILVCLVLGPCLICGQAGAEDARAYLGFGGGLAAVGPALAEEFRPAVTLEGFVGHLRPDSMVIRLGTHWIGFGVAAGSRIVGHGGPGDEVDVG